MAKTDDIRFTMQIIVTASARTCFSYSALHDFNPQWRPQYRVQYSQGPGAGAHVFHGIMSPVNCLHRPKIGLVVLLTSPKIMLRN